MDCCWCLISLVVVAVVFMLFLLYKLYLSNALPNNQLDVNGKHVYLSGGSSGIGLSLALELYSRGAHLTLIARNTSKLQEAKQHIELMIEKKESRVANLGVIHLLPLDLSKNPTHIADTIHEHETKLSVETCAAINCAGVAYPLELEKLTTKQHEDMMSSNYFTALYLTHAIVPLVKQHPQRVFRLVFTSSMAGQCGVYGYTGYGAAKYALRGLAEALQMELSHTACRITVSYPPDTDTPGYQHENEMKPMETRLISGKVDLYRPDQIASILVEDILAGHFFSVYGMDGWMLGHLTSGMSPYIPTFSAFILQFLFLGIFRLISLFVLKSMYSIVQHSKAKPEQDKKDS